MHVEILHCSQQGFVVAALQPNGTDLRARVAIWRDPFRCKEFLVNHERRPQHAVADQFPAILMNRCCQRVGNEAVDGALHAQPVQEDDLLRLRNDMHDHQMARPTRRV